VISVEQQFRDALEAMGFPEAQSFSAGDCMAAAIAAVEERTPIGWMPAKGVQTLREGAGPIGVWPMATEPDAVPVYAPARLKE
jgi:hypothetical protein